MFIPDPRWEEPSLLIPGKKPTGPVTIDWSHPLARGLVGMWSPSGGRRNEIVTGESVELIGDAYYLPESYHLDGVSDFIEGAGPVVTEFPLTMIVRFYPRDAATYAGLFGLHNSTSTGNWFQLSTYTGGGVIVYHRYLTSSGGFAETTNTVNVNEWNWAMATFTSNTERRAVLNHDFSGAATNTDDRANPVGIDVVGIGCYRDSSPSSPLDGMISDVFLFNRVISDAEYLEISRNPYQILCPA